MGQFDLTKLITTSLLYPQLVEGWEVQGLGMLRRYVERSESRSIRLHLWNPALVMPGVAAIHNHPWDFKSTIIKGAIINMRYQEVKGAGKFIKEFKRRLIIPGDGKQLESDAGVWLKICAIDFCLPGDSYIQHRSEIHYTWSLPGSVSIIERQHQPSEVNAAYTYFQGEWGSAKARPATNEEIFTSCALTRGKWGI